MFLGKLITCETPKNQINSRAHNGHKPTKQDPLQPQVDNLLITSKYPTKNASKKNKNNKNNLENTKPDSLETDHTQPKNPWNKT